MSGNADLFPWGTPIERERRTRIRLCIAAYAYEVAGEPLIDDAAYDALALSSDVTIQTGQYDEWWRQCYTPYSGSWIHSHPDIEGIRRLATNPAVSPGPCQPRQGGPPRSTGE